MLWVSPYLSRRESCPLRLPDGTLRQGDELEWSIDLDGRPRRGDLAAPAPGCADARRRRAQGRPRRRARPRARHVRRRARHARAQPLPGRLRARVVRRAAASWARHRDHLPCGDSGVDPGTERRVGRQPGPGPRRTSDGGQDGPDRGRERLPDLGLGHRWVPQRRPHARRLRALGAVRRCDPDLRGGWRRAKCPLLDLRARDGRAVPSRRGVALRAVSVPLRAGGTSGTHRAADRSPALHSAQPADDRSWSADLEFLVGDDLLVAPVTTASGNAHRVYLPPGDWVDVARGTRHAGGHTIRRPTPLDELPLYLRAGTAVPFNARTPGIWSDPWRINDLRRPGRAGWLLAPGPGRASASSKDAGSIGASRKGAVLAALAARCAS